MSATKRDAFAINTPGLAEATTLVGGVQRTLACQYVIDGRTFNLAAANDIAMVATPGTSFTVMTAGQICPFYFLVNAAGTMTVLQGTPVTAPNRPGYVPNAFEWPERDGFAVIGAMVVQTNGSATYTPNVTDLSATDVVDTFVHPGPDYSRPIPY
jgi:hypothetical protein